MRDRRLTRLGVAAAAVALALGTAACGDDDGGGASGEFCDGLVEFNRVATQTDLEEAGEDEVREAGDELTRLWDRVRDNAPGNLDEVIEPISAAIDPLAEGDASRFNSDETFGAYTAFLGEAVGGCDFERAEVTAVDYAFQDVPAELPAGPVVVELRNEADSEEHEFLVFRKNDPDQPTAEILELPEEEIAEAVTFGGVVFASAGESATSLFTLEEGEYVAVCFIPVGGAADGEPHVARGMLTEFSVA